MSFFQKIINQSRDLFYKSLKNSDEMQNIHIHKSRTDNTVISQILFIIYMLNLVSMPFYKKIDTIVIIVNNQIDQIIIYIAYFSNIFNIIQDFMMVNNISIYVIGLVIFYAFMIFLLIMGKILYSSEYLCKNHIKILNIFYNIEYIIRLSYIWLFNLPTANALLFLINHIKSFNFNMIILLIIICIFIGFIHSLLYYTRCDMSFVSTNLLNVRFSFLLEFIIIEHYVLSFLVYSTWINMHDEIIPIICGIFGVIKFYMAWKHLPFTHPIISRLFLLFSGYFVIICINVIIFDYIHINSSVQYSFTILLIIEIPIVTFALLLLWKKISFSILDAETNRLSNTLFDFQMRMIIESLNGSSQNKKEASLALEIFISNHKNKCSDEFCVCQDSSLLRNIDLNKVNVFDKNKTVIMKKGLILNLIHKSIQDKMNKPNNARNNYIKLFYVSFLIWWGQDYFKVYQVISSIMESNPSYLHKYSVLLIRIKLQMILTKKKLESNDELYLIKTIEYYEMLNNFKSSIFIFLENYQQFLNSISKPIIDLNDILIKGKSIISQKHKLIKMVNALQKIYETTIEFYTLINLYAQLGFIDQITSIIENYKNISRKFKHSRESLNIISNPLNNDSCVILSKYSRMDENIPLSKTTPNFYKLFRYDIQNADNITISQLMPKIIGQYHDKYLKLFALKQYCFINYSLIDNIPAIDSQGYVFEIKLKTRFEFFNDEAYLIGLLEKIDQDKDIILLDESNNILTYSYGLSQILLDMEMFTKLPIGLFIPRYLLNLVDDNETRAELYDICQTKGLIEALTGFTQNTENDYESTYLVVPNDINQLLKIKFMMNKTSNKSHIEVLNLAKMIYMNKEETSFSIYKAQLKHKEHNFNDKRISLKSVSLSCIENIDDYSIISLIKQYIQLLSSTLVNRSTRLSNTCPSERLFRCDSLEDLVYENGLADIFPQFYDIISNPTKRLSFCKAKESDGQVITSLVISKAMTKKFKELDHDNQDSSSMKFISHNNNMDYQTFIKLNCISDVYENQDNNIRSYKDSLVQQNNHVYKGLNEAMHKLPSNDIKGTIKSDKTDNNILKDGNVYDMIMLVNDKKIPNIKYNHSKQQHNYNINSTNDNNVFSKKYTYKHNNQKAKVEIDSRSNGSSLSSGASFKAFKDLLNRKISIKQLDWLHYFGILIFIAMIVILIILWLLLKNNINRYSLYVNTSDYSNFLVLSISIYGQYLVQNALIQNGMLLNTSYPNYALLPQSILPQMYQLYKSNFENAIFKQQVFKNSYTLSYENYNMNLLFSEYNNDTGTPIEAPFHYCVSYMMDILHDIDNTNSSIDQYQQYLTFIFKNFPEYFQKLLKNVWDIGDEAYGLESRVDIENFAINMLINCLITTFSFIFLIYPIYYSIETKKMQGISYISTISILEIMKINSFLEKFLDYSIKQVKMDKYQVIITKKKSIMKNIKSIRQWEFKRFSTIAFIAILILLYGIWSAFFVVQTVTVIQQNKGFKQYYYEYDFMTDVLTTINSEFFMAWLTIYIQDNKDYQGYYFENYEYPKKIFQDRLSQFVSFWMNIDQFLSNNTQMTDFYLDFHSYLKDHDLCLYISAYIKDENDLKNCQETLNNAMKNGILKAMLMFSESLVDRIRIPMEQELTLNRVIETLNSPLFNSVNELQLYMFYLFQQYIYDIKLNLNRVLDSNLKGTDLFLGFGIFMFIISFLVFWMPFVSYLRKELYYVKKIYCCLPALTIMQNPYVKKWLNDNSLRI